MDSGFFFLPCLANFLWVEFIFWQKSSDPFARFDGRTIRVDRASDNGPRGGGGFANRGDGRSYGGRGGYGAPAGGYGGAPSYGAPNMYQQAPYGRGYPQPQPGYGMPPQGISKSDRCDCRCVLVHVGNLLTLGPRLRRPSTVWWLPECSPAATATSSARRRSLLNRSHKAAADSHPKSSFFPTERGLEPFQSRVIEE